MIYWHFDAMVIYFLRASRTKADDFNDKHGMGITLGPLG